MKKARDYERDFQSAARGIRTGNYNLAPKPATPVTEEVIEPQAVAPAPQLQVTNQPVAQEQVYTGRPAAPAIAVTDDERRANRARALQFLFQNMALNRGV